MNVLGISAFYHDSAACLVRNGDIVAAAQQERFSRRKHDPDFPADAVAYCLAEGGIDISDVDCVAFYDKPWVKFERLLLTYLGIAPRGLLSFYRQMPLWLKERFFMRRTVRTRLGYDGPVLFTSHHQSHAAAAFFPSPFDRAAILTVDGVGEWATSAIGVGEGNRVRLLREMRFPHSLGLLYSAFTYFTGFKVNSGEYKLMGLAPYGEPRYVDRIYEHLLDLRDDGSFRLNLEYFDFLAMQRMTDGAFEKLFDGPRRTPESEITAREMDLAASIQAVTEEILLRMARTARRETDARRLVIAGGVGLNCVANGRILREGIFDDIWIQPAAGDAGSALGCALFVWHQLEGRERVPDARRQKATYLGPSYSNDVIRSFLDEAGIPYRYFEDEDALCAHVAERLAEEKVVGWFQGRMEFGPRALGARSILGDPRSPRMQSTLNLKIKFRESFRPFAPSVLVEHASEYFDLDRPSPYMLLVADVRADKRVPPRDEDLSRRGLARLGTVRSVIPAVTHVDNSARVQTVAREDNPRYYRLIEKFYERTGCPVLINTSFNVRGEPIVCTPQEAYTCFMRTHMDYLVLGNFVLDKADQPAVEIDPATVDTFEKD